MSRSGKKGRGGVSVTLQGAGDAALSQRLVQDAAVLLAAYGLPRGELSLVLCDDRFIHTLNQRWRGVDSPTDVLSFAMTETAPNAEGAGAAARKPDPNLLGDLVISLDTAARQAAEQGHGLDEEIRVLLVHGFLHLCGYDHLEPEDAAEMRDEEAAMLRRLEVARPGLVARAGIL